MKPCCALVFLLCLYFILCGPSFAFEMDYMPLRSELLSRRVRQELLFDGLEPGQKLKVGVCTISINENQTLVVYGSDREGKPWSMISRAGIGYASIWTADLDRNGRKDLLILVRTGSCGWEPGSQLITLMFEQNRRPIPWMCNGYFELDDRGIKDLLDIDGDGRAELVKQSHRDGYWLTSIYESGSCTWHKLDSICDFRLPLCTRFTQASNLVGVSADPRAPVDVDLSNGVGAIDCCTKLPVMEVDWALKLQDSRLTMSDGRKIRLANASSDSACALILDEPSGRRMTFLSELSAARSLLTEIKHRQIPIIVPKLSSTLRTASTSPVILFARETSRRANSLNPSAARNLADLKNEENWLN